MEGFNPIPWSCQVSKSLGSCRDPTADIPWLFLAALVLFVPLIRDLCQALGTSLFPGRRRGWQGALQAPDHPLPAPGFVLPSTSKGLARNKLLEAAWKVKGEGGKQLCEWSKPGCLRFLQQAQPTAPGLSKGRFLQPLSVLISCGPGSGIVAQGTECDAPEHSWEIKGI